MQGTQFLLAKRDDIEKMSRNIIGIIIPLAGNIPHNCLCAICPLAISCFNGYSDECYSFPAGMMPLKGHCHYCVLNHFLTRISEK